ncbi:uncharacterized protein N7477_010208 [Penicillium maclennaniae]|uniref:uncharacterized protein n=1 Tax=Penicillium maclennaniae TaxID=1343394 RepID=UPI00253FD0DB|nr:uncharacterized protein N7477_010208 [Penicillium maclennaniae]KAJ5662592.1 hypothetical protein N7477_010208 [Penicillium maclennaniae]
MGEEHVPDSTQNEMQAEPPHEAMLTSTDDLETAEEPSGLNPMQNQFSVPKPPEPSHAPENHRNPSHSRGLSRGTLQSSVSPNVALGLSPDFEGSQRPSPRERADYGRLLSTESVSQRSEKEEFQDIFSELMTGTEHEVAFLIRNYAQVIAPWLDVSDMGKFFAVLVPIRAINCNALKYSIAALSAKQLGRVKGAKSSAGGGMFTSPATTEVYPNSAQVDWYLKAANYYYLAVSDLNSSTSDGYTLVSSSAVLDSPIELVGRWLNKRTPQSVGQASVNGAFVKKAEDMLASIALLTLYKLLDAKGEEWHMHLSGIQPLFDSFLRIHQKGSVPFPHGIRASFWNFVRQDYLGSYFARSETHLDPQNLPLWRAAGIKFDDQEKLHALNSGSTSLILEDQAANGLSWLISKVANFLAKSKQSQMAQWTGSPPNNLPGSPGSPSGSSEHSYPNTNTWLDLCFEFQTWFEGVPETFRPCVRIEHPRDLAKPESGQLPFPEVFFSLATCAVTMQHYHFGRIALLLNRPPDTVSAPSTAFDRLQGYREVTKEVEYRSREVCGIALGRPQGEVRVYMVPLLFAVGQCLEGADERKIIVDLLRGVEADLGWATEFAVQSLQSSWSR